MEKRKRGKPKQSVIPDTGEEGSRRTGGRWGPHQWQVRERLKVSAGFGNMEVAGNLHGSSFHGVGVQSALG